MEGRRFVGVEQSGQHIARGAERLRSVTNNQPIQDVLFDVRG